MSEGTRIPLAEAQSLADEVLGPEVIARAERIREVHCAAVFWGLDPTEVKGLLLVRWLIEAGRLGKDDRN